MQHFEQAVNRWKNRLGNYLQLAVKALYCVGGILRITNIRNRTGCVNRQCSTVAAVVIIFVIIVFLFRRFRYVSRYHFVDFAQRFPESNARINTPSATGQTTT